MFNGAFDFKQDLCGWDAKYVDDRSGQLYTGITMTNDYICGGARCGNSNFGKTCVYDDEGGDAY